MPRLQNAVLPLCALCLVVTGCGSAATSAPRPDTAETCPETPRTGASQELANDLVTMRGDLLIAPRGQSYVNPTLLSEEAGPAFAAWGHNKAVFFRKPGASGEISITGRRLDAAGVVKFVSGGATRVSDAFVLHAGEGSNVTGMLIPASGCYELSVTAGGRRATLVFDTTLCSATPLGTTPAAGAIPPCSR